jgi:hypothetical protein
VSVCEAYVDPDCLSELRPHQLGHLRRAAKLMSRVPWRENQIVGRAVAQACLRALRGDLASAPPWFDEEMESWLGVMLPPEDGAS